MPAMQSLIRCEPVDYVSLATLHERSPLKTIDALFGLRCRRHLCPGSDPREGQAWLGYEWSWTTSNQWTLVFTPPRGKQMTVRNGAASWVQQRSSQSRLWRERERERERETLHWKYFKCPKLIQTAKTLRNVKVKTAQVVQEKKQKISMFLNENISK